MTQETLNTVATVGTFIVIAATAIAAVVQLRHLRDQNQLTGLPTVLERVEDPQFNEWVDGARELLRLRMPDPAYRRTLLDGTFDRRNNPWLNLANSYDWVGSLVKHKLIPEESLLDVYSSRIIDAWQIVEGVVPLVRAEDRAYGRTLNISSSKRATGACDIRTELIQKASQGFRLMLRGRNSHRHEVSGARRTMPLSFAPLRVAVPHSVPPNGA
ncbi:MAG: hypothetical protein WCD38_12555 [Candidatus Tumulicola sp.]